MWEFLWQRIIIYWKKRVIFRFARQTPILGIDLETMKKSTNRKNFGITPITQELITLQQQVADKFYELKLIPKQIDVKEAMLTSEQYAAFSPKTQ